MEDWAKVLARLLAILALTIHDYIHFKLRHRQRTYLKRSHLRRLSPSQRSARYRAKWKRGYPYTGETRRL